MRGYCYKVASTVGSFIEIYGYENPDAREHAEEMGIFLQMVNILRDIQEDLEHGRVYSPRDEMNLWDIRWTYQIPAYLPFELEGVHEALHI